MKKRVGRSMRISLKAIAEDEASREFEAIIKFRDIDGKYRSLSLPLSELEDIKALKKRLRNRGCNFSKRHVKSETALTNLANSTKDVERWKFAA